jgi:hypothetical protein
MGALEHLFRERSRPETDPAVAIPDANLRIRVERDQVARRQLGDLKAARAREW